MSQAESKRSREIMAELRLNGWFCFKVHGNGFMMAGLPDVIVCAEGYFIGLETKMPSERSATSAKQDQVHDEIRAAAGYAGVAVTKREAVKKVREYLALKRGA